MIKAFNDIIMKIAPGIIFFVILTSCNQQSESGTVAEKKEVKADSVAVFMLTKDSAKKTISLPGELLADENAQIRAKSQGYIKRLNVDIGSKVTRGQVLALIDAPEVN